MSANRNAESAFPRTEQYNDGSIVTYFGMSLRDYFAAKALQGMLADSQIQGSPAEFATRSYALADAMMEARAK